MAMRDTEAWRKGIRRTAALTAHGCIALLAIALSAPASALAQSDLAGGQRSAPGDAVSLPDDFLSREAQGVRWIYPEMASSQVDDLQERLPEIWSQVVADLGHAQDPDLEIRVGRDPAELRRLAPVGAPPPSYAAGVAYPERGLVLLGLVSPLSWQATDLVTLLTHELSHVAAFRAAGNRRLPRWFGEGLAVHQAGEHRLQRIRTLWLATLDDTVLPLEKLENGFPTHPDKVSLAYAQSADLVSHMLRTGNDRHALSRTFAGMAAGLSFEESVLEAYDVPLSYLVREWRAALPSRFHSLPLILTGTTLWALFSGVLGWAFLRRRWQHHKQLRAWTEEEEAEQAAAKKIDDALRTLDQPSGPDTSPEAAQRAGWPPQQVRSEPPVPTVEHDGRQHTLH